jgi:hypothetical protein
VDVWCRSGALGAIAHRADAFEEKSLSPDYPYGVELLVTSAPDFAIQNKALVRAKGRDLGARDG